jgi:hypothetical protein
MHRRTTSARLPILFSLLAALAAPAFPQILLDSTEDLAWNRPEAWAMKYFTAVSMMSDLGSSTELDRGAVSIAFEAGWVPSLSEEERRVGFIGSKVEDLNRTSVFGRLRTGYGLPAGWTITVGYVPPLEVEGVTPEIFTLALGRAVLTRASWTLSSRVTAQVGELAGDLTCPADIVGSSDPAVNPDNCLEPSADEVTMDYTGIELTLARTADERWRPFLSASANHYDLELQVRARYSLFLDRVRQRADGWVYTLAAGARYQTAGNTSVAAEIFYAPLDVVRDVAHGSQNDPLLNARLLIEYRIR